MADSENDASRPSDEGLREGSGAEKVFEDLGRRVGRFFASAAARAREEADDILAEAQSIKRGERE